jgi:PTS system nitrogen regulatory IIA component
MRIEDVLKESCIIAELKGRDKRSVIYELARVLKDAGLIEEIDKVAEVLLERERLGSTGIGDGVAIPHGKMKGLKTILCAFGRSKEGVEFDAVDGKPVHLFFLLIAPEDAASLHLKMLSRVSRLFRDPSFRKRLLAKADLHEIYSEFIEEDRKF